MIKTKYVVLFSDDDFPIINSFNKLISFLDKSKSYVACGGFAFNFDLLNQTNSKNEIYGHPINFGKMMNAKSNEKNDKVERLNQYLEVMENSWHYIFRTKILLKNYEIVHKKNALFTNVDFYDFFQDANNFFSGRIKKINALTFLGQPTKDYELIMNIDEIISQAIINWSAKRVMRSSEKEIDGHIHK